MIKVFLILLYVASKVIFSVKLFVVIKIDEVDNFFNKNCIVLKIVIENIEERTTNHCKYMNGTKF